jgi:putative resolvase
VMANNAVLYARVSSGDQVADLDRQMQRLRDYAAVQGLHVVQEVQEIGSGLNGHRKKLMKVLENPSASAIVVEHRDRLARFGSEYIESALAPSNRKVVIVNDTEMKDDLVQDMVDVLTSLCARLYGKRAPKNKAKRALEATEQ